MQVLRRTLQCFPLNLSNLGAPCLLKCSVGYNRSWTNTRFNSVNSVNDDDIEKIAARIDESSNIVVMSGAGISTASGIQDFRSPGSGVYDNLAKYNLPYPEAVFELEYFKENPKPFNTWAKQFFPGVNYLPNTGHYFIKLLEEKGKLSKLFTQNIDGLERIAGIKEDKLVEAHGTFNSASCISCQEAYSIQTLRTQIQQDITPTCHTCQGLIKPNIIFFGESLPGRFFDEAEFDCMFADLLICIGTSLEVYPFAGIADVTRHNTPRILLNNNLVGSFGTRPNDSVLLGDINASIEKICDRLGWSQQIQILNNSNKP